MRSRILIPLMALLAFIMSGIPAYALSIDAARLGAHPDKTRLVFDLSNSADFRVFTLDGPYRLVVDLPVFEWRAGALANTPQSGIKGLRHGHLEAGISRIVFDMDAPLSVRSAFVLPQQDGKPHRLVVDLVRSDHAAFMQSKHQIFGNLEASGGILATPAITRAHSDQAQAYTNARMPVPERKPALQPREYGQAPPVAGSKPLIVLDPGHGGVDPGAIGANGVHEKNVVLSLARALKRDLENSGRYRVMLTRDNDVFIKLADRVKFARNHGADLFVSIHADSLPRPNVRGTSIYTLSDKASDEQTEKLAARENKADLIAGLDLSVEDQDVANILVNLAMRDTMNQSKFFANTVVSTFDTGGLRLLERPHRYAGFAVLKAPDIPSVLVEAGFMSNKQEANMLSTAEYQKKFAVSMTKAINAYFNTVSEYDQD